MAAQTDECCPPFDPAPWEDKQITWTDKKFLHDSVRSVFHVPIKFGVLMQRNMTKIAAADAADRQTIVLCDERSPWRTHVFISVAADVPDSKMTAISGTFLTRVFEGPYKNVRNWYNEMQQYVIEKGMQLRQIYAYYTTCPNCAKKYGKNYVVLLAQV